MSAEPDPAVVAARDERDRRIRDTARTATRGELHRISALRSTMLELRGPVTIEDTTLFDGLTRAMRELRRALGEGR